jgi:hypothetical protein
MRSFTARALLALVLLTVALEAVPTEQQTTVLQSLTLTAVFNIEPGDAVAPHIYDWYLDGVDDYVVVRDSASLNVNYITIYVWVRLSGWTSTSYQGILNKYTATGGYFLAFKNSIKSVDWVLRWTDGSVAERVSSLAGDVFLSWRNIVLSYDGVIVKLFIDSTLDSTYSKTGLIQTTPGQDLLIGKWIVHALNGFISQILVYSRALSDSEIAQAYNNNVVSTSDLVLFLDATFYNGTRYIDLSGRGNHGVGYGGVSRVLSSRPHLYLVKGLHDDGLVHFRFFPVNTVVDVYNAATNRLVASFTIDGPANPAGLVEDYAVSLGPGSYRLAVYTTVYVQVAQPALPAFKLVVAHFKAEMGPGCRVYIDYTAWPKAEPRTECGLQTDVVFLTGLPAGATVRVWNETVLYEVTASSTGVAMLGGLKPGAYEVKVYSDTLSIPHDHLLRLDPLSSLRRFFGFWDRLTFNLFTPVFVVGLVLAVYLRTWSAVLTALVALAVHIVIAPDNIWIRGLLALALAVAVYIAVWRRTTLI